MSMPTHSEIMDYWKNKCITEDFNIAIEGEYDYSKSMPIIKDWGEPECWCCGKFIDDVYSYKNYEVDLECDYHRVWDYKKVKSKLNRCHIIPKALGGEDKPHNLFLMCESCHEESPDFADPTYFFAFVYSKRKQIVGGIDIHNFINNIIYYSKILNKDVTTLDAQSIDKNKFSTHGAKLSESTKMAMLLDTMKQIEPHNEEKYMKEINDINDIFKAAI